MNQSNMTTDTGRDRHADLLRQAERQGIRPLSFDELLGDGAAAGDAEKEDVDDFLALRHEARTAERARARE